MVSSVTSKSEIARIDGTPEKRVFWSLIADYGLRTGLCELIDNAIDLWTSNGRNRPLEISVRTDQQRQLISVEDNAGGVSQANLRLLITPGGSRNTPEASVIGVFGVGSKRASVAIGEHVEIRTRHRSGATHQIDVTREWLESSSWDLAAYQVPNIAPNTTRVEISKLRRPFDEEEIACLKIHFSETYSLFIQQGCTIFVDGEKIQPTSFDKFAFPKGFRPKRTQFKIELGELGTVSVRVEAGLILDRDPEANNYGVYIYCNDRLIVKEWQSRDIGYFITREAGVPHPDASLSRVIVWLDGAARAMPWNSSKSAIDTDHFLFHQIRPTIISLNSYFSSLSRRWKNDWEGEVFKYTQGSFEDAFASNPGDIPRVVLAPLPRVHKPRIEDLKDRNKKVIRDKPWTLGLVEAMAATDVVMHQKFDTRNRIALILLDSNFEIALKEFIVHRTDLFNPKTYTDSYIAGLFGKRTEVIKAVRSAVPALKETDLEKAKHFYSMRNKLIHERASTTVSDNDIQNYRVTIESILKTLFALKF